MKNPIKYELPEDTPGMVSESVGVATARDLSHLEETEMEFMNGNFLTMTEADGDKEMFIKCIPCSYSDEEFKDEVALSEASGFVSNEEFKRTCLEKWGVAL